jgi:hypothetical protein
VWSDGRVYNGSWVESQMHGMGTLSWPDGRSYTGEFKNDKKHGFGVYTK